VAKKKKPLAALFVDLPSMHQALRNACHRLVDPELLAAAAEAHGKLERRIAISDWEDGPNKSYTETFEEAGFDRIQASRVRFGSGGRRREIMRDGVPLELFAQVIEQLFRDEGPEMDSIVIATADPSLARLAGLLRERFQKDVRVIGVEEEGQEALVEAATGWEALELPEVEPTDLETLEKVIKHLEELEKRKPFLNFKYIRETVVRKVELPERSFEAAERILSEAVACGVLIKKKVEDKYKEGEFFTAYAIDRENEYFERYGSGEPAPVHEPSEPKPRRERNSERGDRNNERGDRNGDRNSDRNGRGRNDDEPGSSSGHEEGEGKRKRKRRRRRKKSNSSGNGGDPVVEEVPAAALAAGTGSSRKNRGRRGRKGGPHNQDRVGRMYEAPSRFLVDPEERVSQVSDEDIDEDQILKHLKM
jgi:NYN domain-containing protein